MFAVFSSIIITVFYSFIIISSSLYFSNAIIFIFIIYVLLQVDVIYEAIINAPFLHDFITIIKLFSFKLHLKLLGVIEKLFYSTFHHLHLPID